MKDPYLYQDSEVLRNLKKIQANILRIKTFGSVERNIVPTKDSIL